MAALNRRFHAEHPREVIRWTLEESGLERVAIASSFQAESTVVIHLATRIRPDIPVLFLETGFHFAETLAFKERLTALLGLNVIDLVGEHTVESQEAVFGPRLFERDPVTCCRINKVEPLHRALEGFDAWLTGLRRGAAPTRADAPILALETTDAGRPRVKVNPVVTWSRREIWGYLKEHGLPHHPLYDLGYASIGCAPCTRALFPGEEERDGRWAGVHVVECGIHLPARAEPG